MDEEKKREFKEICKANFRRIVDRIVLPAGVTPYETAVVVNIIESLNTFADIDIPTIEALFEIGRDKVVELLNGCRLKIDDQKTVPFFSISHHNLGVLPDVVNLSEGVHGFLDS